MHALSLCDRIVSCEKPGATFSHDVLDAKLRVQMRAELKEELHQRLRTTTIYVTHDQVEAMTMANKIVVMRNGIVLCLAGAETAPTEEWHMVQILLKS